jgi:uncharacterized protein (DUF952 family)
MTILAHALPEADWAAAQRTGEYAPDTLESEGFIRLFSPADVVDATNARFAEEERDDISLFVVYADSLGDAFRYEQLGDEETEPRLYRSVETDAVAKWGPLPRDRHGFHLPKWAVEMVEDERLPEERKGERR